MTQVEVTGLTYRYPRSPGPSLEDVDLRVEKGEMVLLAGPSGGGKSTLLSLIVGETTSDTGFIFRRKGLTIGTLAQEPQLQPGRTVWQEALTASSELASLQSTAR